MSDLRSSENLVCAMLDTIFVAINTNITMKKLLWSFLVFLTTVGLSSQASIVCFPDEGDELESIDISVDLPGTPVTRSAVEIPFEVGYNRIGVYVAINFYDNIGEVSVIIKNLSTGTNATTLVDSSCGSCCIPVTGGYGFYRIEFVTSDGTVYYGYFTI